MVDAGRILIRGLVVMAVVGLLTIGCSAGGSALKEDPAAGLAKVQGIDVAESADTTAVHLSTDRPVTFTSVKISDPPMMVLDLAGAELGDVTERIEVGKAPVTFINPSRDSVSKRIARIEIGLDGPTASSISQDGTGITILFEKRINATDTDAPIVAPASETADAGTGEAAYVQSETATASQESGTLSPAGKAASSDASPSAAASLADATTVQDISFSKSGKALNLSVVGDGRISDTKVFMVGEDRLVLDILGVGALKDKDTIKIGGPCVRQVRMASHTDPDEKVRVVLDLTCEIDYDVKSDGNKLVVAVAPRGTHVVAEVAPSDTTSGKAASKAAGNAVASPATDKKVETAMSTGRKVTVSVPPAIKEADDTPKIYVTQKDGRTILSSTPSIPVSSAPKVVGSNEYVVTETKIYTGGKISFDIQDADLDKVIKLLADVAGLNLIVNPADVKGKVTLKLANVPWDQALDILLKIYNLDKVLEGNVLRVAPKKKLAEERKIDLRAIAEQKKLMEEAEDLYTKTFKINYADASSLEGKVKKILTKRGEATSNPRTNELIVTDIKDKIEEAGQLIDILDKQVNQILIEARIVTVDVGYSQSLGVSWGLAGQANIDAQGEPKFGLASGSQSSLDFQTTGDFILALPTELGAEAAGLATGMTWTNIAKGVNLDLTISALESINKAETLAAPKVMTLENEKAEITQGTTLYVQTTSASGTKPEPLNANLSLTVIPRVTGDNFITMDVKATNNTPASPPPGSTAAIETQAVTTNIIVKDGDTIVLGGIYVKTKSKGDSQVPWLGRIPILGWLFKERTTNETTSELLIFITPKLVKQQTIRT